MSLDKLEPWPFSKDCQAGLREIYAPIRLGTTAVGWLITGHIGTDDLPGQTANVKPSDLPLVPNPVPATKPTRETSPEEDHHRVSVFIEIMGDLLGSEINALLTEIREDDPCRVAEVKRSLKALNQIKCPEVPNDVSALFATHCGMEPCEYLERCRVEDARREILSGSGNDEDLLDAIRRAGWWDRQEFHRCFEELFHEGAQEHYRRTARLHSRLVDSISKSGSCQSLDSRATAASRDFS